MAQAPLLIAIVDDDASVLKALTRLLRTHAFDSRGYRSAQEFLAALPDRRPDCLVLDLQMPEMSGLELMQRLANAGIAIPTIVLTAQGDAAVRRRCDAFGVVAFLTKPLQDTALFAAIEEARLVQGRRGADTGP